MTSSLPNPRELLTSLLNSLTSTPTPNPLPQTNQPYDAPSNPLKNLPASHRALLTTLHVLFPPPMLLQALDLLDRGLVTRITLQTPPLETPPQDITQTVHPPQADSHLAQTGGESMTGIASAEERKVGEGGFYLVRSSQAPKGRFKDVGMRDSAAMTYTVRLGAWNCSCAAFTFAAFPGNTSSWIADFGDEDEDEDGMGSWRGDGGEKEEGREWKFGGWSNDGVDGGNVPVCKHLLACLLGERWVDVLGGYVKEREVGRDELAGIGGEG